MRVLLFGKNAFGPWHERRSNTVSAFQGSGAAAILSLSLFLTALSRGDEPSAQHFDIGAQSLSTALNEFARQSRQQVLFAPDVVAQKLSSPLRDDMQPLAALKVLLKDSGLTFKTTPSGAILIGNPNQPLAAAVNVPKSEASDQSAGSSTADLASITVEGVKEKEVLRQQITSFVLRISQRSYLTPLARWEKPTPVCPLIAGLSHDDGEYMLRRLSQIAVTAGAPVAPAHCKPNFYVIVTSEPSELMKAWSKRDPWMFDDDADGGGTVISNFLNASTPVRAWYNIAYSVSDDQYPHLHLRGRGVRRSGLPDLSSVILIVDARLAKGISFGQLAAYLAMVGLAQIRLDANVGNATTILQAFSSREKTPAEGLSPWDQAYLKALYHTQHTDKTQRLAIARSMAHEIAP